MRNTRASAAGARTRPAATQALGASKRRRAAEPASPDTAAPEPAAATASAAVGEKQRTPLLELAKLGKAALVSAAVVCRPSARNKSPYVMDVRLAAGGDVAIAHAPCMDMGGKCCAGAEVLVRPILDAKGRPVPRDATGKFGTPKCELTTQLLRCTEPENAAHGGCWVGAHPAIGEQVAAALLELGLVPELRPVASVRRQVGVVPGSRADYVLDHGPGAPSTVLEVKMVVDTDHDPALDAPRARSDAPPARYHSALRPYRRAAIFPWGRGGQKGPDGERVVSARAIKHVDELAAIARGEVVCAGGERMRAALLFVVVRSDAQLFRPNHQACPSFARHLRAAHDAGVAVLAQQVGFDDAGGAYALGPLPIEWPDAERPEQQPADE